MRSEIKVMRALDHANVCKLYDVYEDPTHLFLVLEMCRGNHVASLCSPISCSRT
jgi:serine/threonine protein kinase